MVKNGNKLVFDQDSSGKDTSYIQNKRTNEKIWLRQENGVYVLLQPFDENLVDEEEQRGDRVEENEDIQDDDKEREEAVAQGERARPLSQPRLPSRREFREHELTHILCRSWCVHCVRGAGRSDAHRRRARQDEEEREQHVTTWSIDYAFMIDNGDLCTREEMERVGWDKTRDTVLVSEDLVTGGIRSHLVSAKGNGDPWIAGKIKDDIEESGYCGALVRIKVGSRTSDC